MALTRTLLFSGEVLSARYVECRCAAKEAGEYEYSDGYTLILPIRGAFMEHYSSRHSVIAEPCVALLFQPQQASRISHPMGEQDDCLVFEFGPSTFQETAEELGARTIRTDIVLHPSLQASRNLACKRMRLRFATPVEIEETGLSLLAYYFRSSGITERRGEPVDSFREKAFEVRKAMLQNPGEPWKLSTLAERVECSPYHLSRMFSRLTGMSMHRYLLNARLARAVDLLLETRSDITTIALELGFNSHSHFTSAFHKMVGVTPQIFRKSPTSHPALISLLKRAR